MDLTTFYALRSADGQEALAAAMALGAREADFLRHFDALRRRFPAELARAALETAILRGEAGGKFPMAGEMYFTRPALEQASSFAISSYRARRYAGCEWIADLGCSIGGDTLALAGAAPTVGIDLDPLRLAMAGANLAGANMAGARESGGQSEADPGAASLETAVREEDRRVGRSAAANLEAGRSIWRSAFVQADLGAALPLRLGPGVGLFFDPARRSGEKRIFSVRAYHPPLDMVKNWLPHAPALGVKISPGVDLAELAGYDCEVEFISLRGELKEAVLWFGPLKSAKRRATLLPGPHTLTGEPFQAGAAGASAATFAGAERALSKPLDFLYEPDPAVLRAGLVGPLAEQLGAFQLDADIAYLTAARQVDTPFARAYPVEAWFPFQLKRLRAALRERRVGRVTVKKRGSPLQPEALIRDLRLSGDEERIVFLTHLRGEPIVILSTPNQ